MRRSWLLIGIALLAAVFAIGAVACGDDDDNGDDADNIDDIIDDVIDDLDDDLVLLLTATVAEADGSGVAGAVDLSVEGDGITVSVVLTGLPEGARANHLHHGDTCPPDPGGDIHITLDDVVADAAGAGIQTTSNDDEPLVHFETGHYYAVHSDDGAVIGCGAVVSGIG